MNSNITATVRPEITVILEDAGGNWSAYAPAIPGVAAVGDTPEECRQSMEEALTFHLEGLAEDAAPVLARLAEEARIEMEAAAKNRR